MITEIDDFDGIISLVNADRYKTFVDEEWELDQLKAHFIDQMNEHNIVVWQTNNLGGGLWKVDVVNNESLAIAHSEFTTTIEVTNGTLYLADYTDLTMAAQFEDEVIPAEGHESQRVDIENGLYDVKVRRLFDPEAEFKGSGPAFEVVLLKRNLEQVEKVDTIFWWTV